MKATALKPDDSKLAIPGYVLSGLHPEVERLMFAYGRCTRRSYNMKWKAASKGLEPDRLNAIRQLTADELIPSRYVVTAYDYVDALPAHVTFGGKELQQLRQLGKISVEEYRLRRNGTLACRGEATRHGNLCLRIEDGKLRVTVGEKRWIWLPIQIPEKYQRMLREAGVYTVVMKRRLDRRGYDVRIIVDAEATAAVGPASRVMALDINSGHVDLSVVNKANLTPVVFGKMNCHEFLSARKGTKRILTHRLVKKVRNIAKHYEAEVVVGNLHTSYTYAGHRFNRRVQGMNQYAIRQVMGYKLPLSGVGVSERSEANTSKVGAKLAGPLGLDVHKASAYAFAIKSVDFNRFQSFRNGLTSLEEFCAYDGDGIPSMKRLRGSGLTVPHQASLTRLMCSELGIPVTPREATPKQGKGGAAHGGLQSSILHVGV